MKQHVFTKSSQVKAVRYFADTQILEIDFVTGKTYQYFEVPESVYEGCVTAESVGKYINQHVKNIYNYQPLVTNP